MNSICLALAAAATLLIAGAVRAADPPTGSMDLGALKPKSDTASPSTPVVTPIGQSSLTKLKANNDKGTAGTTGIASSITSPLGTKGILGSSVAGGKPAPSVQDDAASTDVVVKMPSNMKK